MESLVETLMTRFPQTVLSVEADTARSEVTVQVAAERILDLTRFLHDAPDASFDHLTDICSVDYPEDRQRFEVVYHLHSLSHHRRLRVKTRLSEDDPTIASVTSVWKGAEFLEREVYDMMGIRFSGHPDLRRILLPEDYAEGYPLRKDFPAEGRGWRSQFEFIPRLDEPPVELADGEIPEPQKEAFRAEAPPDSRRREELLLNMGPQHPSTHGVLRVVLELDGERIVKATPDLDTCTAESRNCAKGWPICRSSPTRTDSTTSARWRTTMRTYARSKSFSAFRYRSARSISVRSSRKCSESSATSFGWERRPSTSVR